VVEGYVLWYDSRLKLFRRGIHDVTLVAFGCGMVEILPGTMLHLRQEDSGGWWIEVGAIPYL
jgi:hypothetical protein